MTRTENGQLRQHGLVVPTGWVKTRFGEIYELSYGKGLPKSARNAHGHYPVFGSSGIVGYHDSFLIDGPALIVGRKGSTGTVWFSSKPCWPIDTTYYIRASCHIDIRFSFYLFASLRLNQLDRSTAVPGLNRNDAYALPVYLPPLSEQHRIVAKIEALLSELDAGIESLKKARAQLATYRQAVLKYAFEGKLTAQWRKENQDRLETREQLLARISRARVDGYEKQLRDRRISANEWKDGARVGKRPRRPVPLSALSPLPESETDRFPTLSTGWAYLRLGLLIDEPKYGTSKKCDYEYVGTGVLRIPNVVDGVINTDDLKGAHFEDDNVSTFSLSQGDILMIRSNGSISIVGKSAIVSEVEEQYLYAGYLMRLRSNRDVIIPEYLTLALGSHFVRTQIEKKAKSTSGVNNINAREVQSLVIPLCSVNEQQLVFKQLAKSLSIVDALDQEVKDQLPATEVLRRAILARAFSGQLVPQDPNDESASVLLDRIKAEREQITSRVMRRKTGEREKTKVTA